MQVPLLDLKTQYQTLREQIRAEVEGVYLWAYEDMHELEKALGRWFEDYNQWKPHEALAYKTPWVCYRPHELPAWRKAA